MVQVFLDNGHQRSRLRTEFTEGPQVPRRAGVVWTGVPHPGGGRRVECWAWSAGRPLLRVPWDLGTYGAVHVDLEKTFSEAAGTAGLTAEG